MNSEEHAIIQKQLKQQLKGEDKMTSLEAEKQLKRIADALEKIAQNSYRHVPDEPGIFG